MIRTLHCRSCYSVVRNHHRISGGLRLCVLLATPRTSTNSTTRGAHGNSNADNSNSSNKNSRGPSSTADKLPDLHAAKHQAVHRAQETLGVKITASVVERVAESAERRVAKAAASKTLAMAAGQGTRSIGKQAAVRTAARTAIPQQDMMKRVLLRYFPANIAARRLGRGILIALPIVGAAFSAWLVRSDMRRTYQEIAISRSDHALALARAAQRENADRTSTSNTSPTTDAPSDRSTAPEMNTSTVNCFGVATAADSANVVAHLLAAFGLYQGWEPDAIVAVESASLVAAVVSTGGAVGGEYLSARRAARLEMKTEAGDDDPCSTGQKQMGRAAGGDAGEREATR